MRLKNLFILVLVLLVVFISLQDIRALTFDCEFRALSACTAPFNNIVFKASAGTNAHGAIYSDTAYTSANGGYGLCCNFYTSRPGTCTADGDGSGYADNKVFRLIGTTNAHAESPQQSTAGYTNICYGNLECVQVSSCPSEYPIDAFSISSFTNAHIGDFNSYGTYKICCKNPNEPIPPNCGDGNIQPPEECDDGSAANGVECTPSYGSSCNYCSSSCSILSVQGGYCSDGLTQTPPEACDDGNLIQTDTCSASCTVTFCGDGYLQTPNGNGGTEQCDDGNTNNGDGCSSTCQFEPCAINSASWSVSTAENNTQVTLSAVGNSQCAGQVVFDIGEVDGIINRDYAHIDPTDTALINVKQVTGSFNGGSPNVAAALWTAEWHQDTGSTTQDPEYVFRATAGPATYDDSGILTVTLPTGVCTLQEIYWNIGEVAEGTNAGFTVVGNSDCAGEAITFEVKEYDQGSGDDAVPNSPAGTTMTSPSYNSQWATTGQWLNDSESSEENPPEYYIHATVTSTGQTLKSEQLTPPAGKFSLLNVTKMSPSEGICLDPYSQTPKIFSCADYDQANCNSIDVCNVTEDVYCPGNLVVKENHGCIWNPDANSGDGLCVETYESFACPICGNGLQELGEECDGNNFINPNTDDNYTCEDFGGTGGDLTCNSQCKIVNTCDGINCNPDGIVQFPGEECDPQGLGNFTKFNKTTGEIIGEWSCTDYDTYDDEGSLVCGNDCLIQRQCTFDEDPDGTGRASDGSCVKSETLISDCNEGTIGVYEVKVKGNWTWGTSYNSKTDCVSAGNPSANCINDTPTSWHYSSTGDLTPRTSCEQEKSNNIPCPAQIRLPFFGGLQMIITLFAIAAIYGLMAVERKKK